MEIASILRNALNQRHKLQDIYYVTELCLLGKLVSFALQYQPASERLPSQIIGAVGQVSLLFHRMGIPAVGEIGTGVPPSAWIGGSHFAEAELMKIIIEIVEREKVPPKVRVPPSKTVLPRPKLERKSPPLYFFHCWMKVEVAREKHEAGFNSGCLVISCLFDHVGDDICVNSFFFPSHSLSIVCLHMHIVGPHSIPKRIAVGRGGPIQVNIDLKGLSVGREHGFPVEDLP